LMNLEQTIEADLKTALLGGDKVTAESLRGLRAALLTVKVEQGKRETGLTDDEVVAILGKEAKKRQESADLFKQGGNMEKHDAELTEKALIEKYLPAQLSEEEITKLVDEAIAATGATGPQGMGQVIGAVRAKAGATADGSVIARIAKERLGQ
ncbi:MAG TPA: GatB/YqeY domain-containing protein, partial [Candidatus Saccharimonadales bacterium]|nr:GatB/YqeY domain-containing protein [Candidatus Saccharimonadales bacterium]